MRMPYNMMNLSTPIAQFKARSGCKNLAQTF